MPKCCFCVNTLLNTVDRWFNKVWPHLQNSVVIWILVTGFTYAARISLLHHLQRFTAFAPVRPVGYLMMADMVADTAGLFGNFDDLFNRFHTVAPSPRMWLKYRPSYSATTLASAVICFTSYPVRIRTPYQISSPKDTIDDIVKSFFTICHR